MHTIKIKINDSVYEHILFFLKNLPSNLVHISHENESSDKKTQQSIKSQIKELFSAEGVKSFREIEDPVAWQRSMRDEWE